MIKFCCNNRWTQKYKLIYKIYCTLQCILLNSWWPDGKNWDGLGRQESSLGQPGTLGRPGKQSAPNTNGSRFFGKMQLLLSNKGTGQGTASPGALPGNTRPFLSSEQRNLSNTFPSPPLVPGTLPGPLLCPATALHLPHQETPWMFLGYAPLNTISRQNTAEDKWLQHET